jgi:threonine/homoserine/homoserine lactone efflux protein
MIPYILSISFGAVIGVASAVPVGPVGLICIQRTILKNRLAGLISGFGAALADGVFAVIGAFGITFIIDFISKEHMFFRIVGSLILIGLGIASYKSKPKPHEAKEDTAITKIEYFLSGFILTITNPLTAILFLLSFANFGTKVHIDGYGVASALVIGVVIGSCLWWFFLTYIADVFGHKIHGQALNTMSRWFGIIILVFGIIILLNALAKLI